MFAPAREKGSATLLSAVLILALAKCSMLALSSLSLPTRMEVNEIYAERTTAWVLRMWSVPEEVRFRIEKHFLKEELKVMKKQHRTRNAGNRKVLGISLHLSCALYVWWRDWTMNFKKMQVWWLLLLFFCRMFSSPHTVPYWYFYSQRRNKKTKFEAETKECI